MALKILHNALICDHDNQLCLADIYFTDHIQEIQIISQTTVSWRDIDTREKHGQYLKTVSSPKRPSGVKIHEAQGYLVIPGAIDAHVHFNTPGFEFREDFKHGSVAAASGGVTTVIDMPCTSVPPVTSASNLEFKLNHLKERSLIDYALWGGVSGSHFNENRSPDNDINELADSGAVGFKTYMVSGMPEFPELNHDQMLRTARMIQKRGLPLAVHAEDHDLVIRRQKKLEEKDQNDWRAYCESRDVLAETTAVGYMRDVAASSQCSVHIVHLSSERGLEIVREARESQIPLTAETCPHYLMFSQNDFKRAEIAAFLKTAPPVKLEKDRIALWEGLKDGTLSFVTTDHAGCDPDMEKASANFWEIYGGIPGVEHRVPFLISEGFIKGRLSLQKTIELLSTNPASYFGLSKSKGSLSKGQDADFAFIDLWKEQKILGIDMHSKGKYTPFEGMVFNGIIEQTWLRGNLIFQKGKVMHNDFGYGQWIKPV